VYFQATEGEPRLLSIPDKLKAEMSWEELRSTKTIDGYPLASMVGGRGRERGSPLGLFPLCG
jgi:hypothetical protein